MRKSHPPEQEVFTPLGCLDFLVNFQKTLCFVWLHRTACSLFALFNARRMPYISRRLRNTGHTWFERFCRVHLWPKSYDYDRR